MNNSTVKIEYIDYTYLLQEMSDSISATIHNITSVIEQQKDLVKLLEDTDADKFKIEISSMKKQIEQNEHQIKLLSFRLDKLNSILKDISDERTRLIVSMLLEALGAANQDGKSIEERKSNKEEVKTYEA